MSPSEYQLYSNLEFYGAFLILFGIPAFFIFLCFLISKKPPLAWIICFVLSVVSIFIALQYDHYYLGQPLSDYEYEHSSKIDAFGGETNEGAAILIGGIPLGVFGTSLVFGSFFAGRFLLKRLGVIKKDKGST